VLSLLTAVRANDPVAAVHRNGVLHIISRARSSIVSVGYSWEARVVSEPVETRPLLWKFIADAEPALRRFVDHSGFPMSVQPDLTGAVALPSGALALTDALGRRMLEVKVRTTWGSRTRPSSAPRSLKARSPVIRCRSLRCPRRCRRCSTPGSICACRTTA